MGKLWRNLTMLAWRESRNARRRLLLYMSSISLGVAALVAIESFSSNIQNSVMEQSRELLGGDVTFKSRQKFPAAADSLVDSLRRSGIETARMVSFPSMGLIPRTGGTRLVQVRGISNNFPLYGKITTEPVDALKGMHDGAHAVVDPALLIAVNAQVGDTLQLGVGRFKIVGTVKDVPGTPRFTELFGPRVFIPERYVAETELLTFGSMGEYAVFLKIPGSVDAGAFAHPFLKRMEALQVRVRDVTRSEETTTRSIDELSDFIAVVGVIALLLGGVGVASGVRAFVGSKIDTIAIMRCMGATSGQVLAIYTVQAAAMGLVGAAIGVVIGIGIQIALVYGLGGILPVKLSVSVDARAVLMGLGVGGLTTLVFAMRPLLAIRNVTPLQVLRRHADADIFKRSRWRQAPQWLLRRIRWYTIRHGIANLYRPANQTMAVLLSLGFGTFLITTLFVVQNNLLNKLDMAGGGGGGNMIFFDVQEDQRNSLDSIVKAHGHRVVQITPLVQMRIAEINGRSTADIRSDDEQSGRRPAGWALRREYRSTFKDSLGDSEKLVAGEWFESNTGGDTSEVSLEQDLAKQLQVKLGDVITWDVQGVMLPARITSLRTVKWARFEPNFFAVFPTAALADAPKQYVVMAEVPGDQKVAMLQRDVVARHPNVSGIDMSLIQRTVEKISNQVSAAIRFIALFSLALSVPVLFSAVAATQRDRLREGGILRTLGATRGQIARIFAAEYVVLVVVGVAVGVGVGVLGGWGVVRWVLG